jgi:hypothetical protein
VTSGTPTYVEQEISEPYVSSPGVAALGASFRSCAALGAGRAPFHWGVARPPPRFVVQHPTCPSILLAAPSRYPFVLPGGSRLGPSQECKK